MRSPATGFSPAASNSSVSFSRSAQSTSVISEYTSTSVQQPGGHDRRLHRRGVQQVTSDDIHPVDVRTRRTVPPDENGVVGGVHHSLTRPTGQVAHHAQIGVFTGGQVEFGQHFLRTGPIRIDCISTRTQLQACATRKARRRDGLDQVARDAVHDPQLCGAGAVRSDDVDAIDAVVDHGLTTPIGQVTHDTNDLHGARDRLNRKQFLLCPRPAAANELALAVQLPASTPWGEYEFRQQISGPHVEGVQLVHSSIG